MKNLFKTLIILFLTEILFFSTANAKGKVYIPGENLKQVETYSLPEELRSKYEIYKYGSDTFPQGFTVDLNFDNVKEWIIVYNVGSGGYSYHIYSKYKGGWKLIKGLDLCWVNKIGPTKTKGFLDIYVSIKHYKTEGGSYTKDYRLIWNGSTYITKK